MAFPSRTHLPASLRSTRITGLPRSYGRSDSCRPHPDGRSPRFMYPAFQPFRLQTPDAPQPRFLTLPLSGLDFLPSPWRHSCRYRRYACGPGTYVCVHHASGRSGLRLYSAGSPPHPAESSLLPYGLVVHLPLLSTSPHGDAVTVSYRPESACLEWTSTTLAGYTLGRTERRPPTGFRDRPLNAPPGGELAACRRENPRASNGARQPALLMI